MINRYAYPKRKSSRERHIKIENHIIDLFNADPYKYLNINRIVRDTRNHHKTITTILRRVCSDDRLKMQGQAVGKA